MKKRRFPDHRWLSTAFCLLTMLFAVVVSSGLHIASESLTEIVECEEIEEAVTVRKTGHRKYDSISTFADHWPSIKPSFGNTAVNIKSERDNFNGVGTFLRT